MLETLSLCLVVGGIYILLLLIIIQGWLLVWQSFLSRFDLLQELLGEDLATGLLGGSDAPDYIVTSSCLNANRCFFNVKDGLDTKFVVEGSHRRVHIFRGHAW